MRKEVIGFLELALWCAACFSPSPEHPTPLIATSIPIATTTAISIATLAEIDLPTATIEMATAVPMAGGSSTPIEIEIEDPPIMSGLIDMSHNFTVISPEGDDTQVVSLPQTKSDGWYDEDITDFNDLTKDENRRSWLVLKTDFTGIIMGICHSFWYEDEALPCNWIAELGVKGIIGELMSITQNGVVQTYQAIAAESVSENLVSPRANPEAYQRQAGGIFADTKGMGLSNKFLRLMTNQKGLILVVCQGEFEIDAEGEEFLPDRQLVFFRLVLPND